LSILERVLQSAQFSRVGPVIGGVLKVDLQAVQWGAFGEQGGEGTGAKMGAASVQAEAVNVDLTLSCSFPVFWGS
jgi:hypothetical protein